MSSSNKSKKKSKKTRKSKKLMDRINMFNNMNATNNQPTKSNRKKKRTGIKKKSATNNKPTVKSQTNVTNAINNDNNNNNNSDNFKLELVDKKCRIQSQHLLILALWCRKHINSNINIFAMDLRKLIVKYSIAKDGILTANELYALDYDVYNSFKLESDYKYQFDKVLLPSSTVITTNPWDIVTKKGGSLFIESFSEFIIEENAMIDLSGKGYIGGRRGFENGCGLGPGCGKTENMILSFNAGGAAYGGAAYPPNAYNGEMYGDKYLNILYLGSGGGSSGSYGGNGGGALQIKCKIFENNGCIKVNGTMGGVRCGSGSGGSIMIICDEFKMGEKGRIEALGGNWSRMGVKGGVGRIRINANSLNINEQEYGHYIQPLPFVG